MYATYRVQGLANRKHHKSNLAQLIMVQNVAAIENKRWLGHALIQLCVKTIAGGNALSLQKLTLA